MHKLLGSSLWVLCSVSGCPLRLLLQQTDGLSILTSVVKHPGSKAGPEGPEKEQRTYYTLRTVSSNTTCFALQFRGRESLPAGALMSKLGCFRVGRSVLFQSSGSIPEGVQTHDVSSKTTSCALRQNASNIPLRFLEGYRKEAKDGSWCAEQAI